VTSLVRLRRSLAKTLETPNMLRSSQRSSGPVPACHAGRSLDTPRIGSPTARPLLRIAASLSSLIAGLATACAQVSYSGPPASSSNGSGWSRVPGLTQDLLLVLGVGVLLLIVLLLWARYFRKKRHHHSSSHHHSSIALQEGDTDSSEHSRRHRHRRKRRRREHRSRNPTLAETGGLPPPRSEGSPPSGL